MNKLVDGIERSLMKINNMLNKELQNAEKLLKFTREYVSLVKYYERLAEKLLLYSVEIPTTQGKMRKLNNTRRSTGEAIERVRHEIHCICVELGVAAVEDWRYGDFETGNSLSGFGSQHVHRRKP